MTSNWCTDSNQSRCAYPSAPNTNPLTARCGLMWLSGETIKGAKNHSWIWTTPWTINNMPHKVRSQLFPCIHSAHTSYRIIARRSFSNWIPRSLAWWLRSRQGPQAQRKPPDWSISLLDGGSWWISWGRVRSRTISWPNCRVHYRGYVHVRKHGIICIWLTPYIGQIQVEDASKPGEITKLVAGDVLHIEQGSRNTFTSLGGICKGN